MVDLTYNFSVKLKAYLAAIDKLRTKILLTPLKPQIERKLVWEANLSKTMWSLSLLDNSLSNRELTKILTKPPLKRLNNQQKDVINQKSVFVYLQNEWHGSNNPVTLETVKKLYDMACRDTLGKPTGITDLSSKRVEFFLEYLQKGREHPAIQAGIAQIQFADALLFDQGNARISRLLAYMFLYKYGYDLRQLLVLDEYFRRDLITFKQASEIATQGKNLTLWLEYFTYGVMVQAKKALTNISEQASSLPLPRLFWKLNNRQKALIESLEKPDQRITNKDVQKMFGVSQITASRDLARLTSLDLLLPHGKGRSVFYTKL